MWLYLFVFALLLNILTRWMTEVYTMERLKAKIYCIIPLRQLHHLNKYTEVMFITKRCDTTQDLKVNWHAEHIIETYFNEKTNTVI